MLIFETKTWKIVDVNKAIVKLYGYSKKEFLQLLITDLNTKSEATKFNNLINQIKKDSKKEEEKVPDIWTHKKKNGEEIKVEIIRNVIKYKGINCKIGQITDVTEKIFFEEKYKKTSEATSEAIVLHREGVIISINKAAEKTFGYKEKELLGKNVLTLTAPRSKKELIERIKSNNTDVYQAYGIRKNGEIFIGELTPKEIDYFGKKTRVVCVRDTSEEAKTKEALNESHRFISTIINNLNGVIYRCKNNKQWTMDYISPNVFSLTGYSPKKFTSGEIAYNNLIDKNYRKYVWDEVQKAIAENRPFQLTYPIINKNKQQVWVWEQGSAVYDNNQKLVALEGYMVDITEQKNVEKEFEKSREAFKKVVEDSPDPIVIHHNGIIEYANRALVNFIGLKHEKQAIGLNAFSFILPMHHKKINRRIALALKKPTPSFIEFEVKLPGGIIKKIETKGTPVFFNKKRCVQVVIHDLSKRDELQQERLKVKVAEETNKTLTEEIENRKIIEQQLLQSQLFSKNLIDSSIDVIMASDKTGTITQVNKAIASVFGYKPSELVGKKTPIIFADIKQQQEINKILNTKGYYKGEVENIRKSGKKFTSYLSASVIKDHKGAIVGTMGVSRDITEQKRNELALKQSEENYRSLFNRAHIGFAKISLNGIIIDANPHFNEMFGLVNNKKKKTYFKNIFSPEEYDFVTEIRKDLLKGNAENIAHEVVCLHTNGNEIVTNMSCSVSLDEQKAPEYFIVLLEDISQKKKTEEKLFLQAAKLNAVFESSSHIIWTINRSKTLTAFNSNFSEIIYKQFSKIVDPYKTKFTSVFAEQEVRDLWTYNYTEAFKGNIKRFEVSLTDNTGNKRWFEVYLYPIFSLKLEVFEVSALGNEITERKLTEQKIIETAAKLNSIFESSSHLIFTINSDLYFTSYNNRYEQEMKGFINAKIELNKTKITDLEDILKDGYKQWKDAIISAFEGNLSNFEFNLIYPDGIKRWRDVYIQPIRTNNGVINEVSVIAHDISEKKSITEKSLLQAAHIKAIFQNSSLMIYTVDRNYVLKNFNDNYARFVKDNFGYKTHEGFDLKKGFNAAKHETEYYRLYNYHLYALEGNSITYESEVTLQSGKTHWFENHLDPIVLEGGVVEGVTYISKDITEKKEAENKVIEADKEKEILLKEVHHRVKNNLQVISSILSLQSSYTEDPKVLMILRESQSRIKSMSFIHETLYQAKKFGQIGFANYLRNIITNLTQTYQLEENKATLNFDLDEVSLDLDTSIPCGLIFNELISNAFKYAFRGNKKGILSVRLKQQNEEVTLSIKDNGPGIPKDLDINNSNSLGFQLVTALADQIGGKLEIKNTNGAEFIINFRNKLK